MQMKREKTTVFVVSEAHGYDYDNGYESVSDGGVAKSMRSAMRLFRSFVRLAVESYYEGADLEQDKIDEIIESIAKRPYRIGKTKGKMFKRFSWESGSDTYEWLVVEKEI